MASMTLAQIVDYVFDLCQNVVVNGTKQDQTKQFTLKREMVELWVNQAYKLFVVKARILKRSVTVTCTTGVSDYVIPTNIVEMITVWYQQGTQRPRKLVGLLDDQQMVWESNTTGTPQKYQNQYSNSSNARLISIYPPAVATGDKIIIKAVLEPDTLATDTATHIIPVTYEPVLLSYVLSKAQLYCGIVGSDKQTPASLMQVFEEQYSNGAADCKARNEYFGDSDLQMQGDIDSYITEIR